MKLNFKIFCLIILLILLTGLVAFVGYRSLSLVLNVISKTDKVNNLVESLLLLRQQETNFVISSDQSYADNVHNIVAKLNKSIDLLKIKFKEKTNKGQLDSVSKQLPIYETAFSSFEIFEKRKNENMVIMEEKARLAMAILEDIKSDQETQLLTTRKQTESFLKKTYEIVNDANLVIRNVFEARLAEKDYILAGNIESFDSSINTINAIFDIIDRMLPRLTDDTDKHLVEKIGDQTTGYALSFSYYKDKKEETRLKDMLQNADNMQAAALTLCEHQKERLSIVQEETALKFEDKLKNADDANLMIKWFLDTRKNEKEVIIHKDEKYRKNVIEQITKMLDLCEDLKSRFTSQENIQRIDEAFSFITAYKHAFDQYFNLVNQQKIANEKMVSTARYAQEICIKAQSDQKQKMLVQTKSAKRFIICGAGITMLFGLLFGYYIVRNIKHRINPVIEGLTMAADQVTSCSAEVASASQTLAAGASQQAASIEEISSSLEEMSSMTKNNAQNAGQADFHMDESKKVAVCAEDSMNQLADSINEVSIAGEKTSKIIKTIDEIAFQTNLLALNAAVESARAGEAGSGFAVVADEVRNLAMRAADAAKDTSNLIESILKKIQKGSDLVDTTSQAFRDVIKSIEKAGALVTEIAASSTEQSKGIEQINTSVFEVDKVTQQNAANAEQSASASEAMSAQAMQMKSLVNVLISIIGNRDHATVKNENPFEKPPAELSFRNIENEKDSNADQLLPTIN